MLSWLFNRGASTIPLEKMSQRQLLSALKEKLAAQPVDVAGADQCIARLLKQEPLNKKIEKAVAGAIDKIAETQVYPAYKICRKVRLSLSSWTGKDFYAQIKTKSKDLESRLTDAEYLDYVTGELCMSSTLFDADNRNMLQDLAQWSTLLHSMIEGGKAAVTIGALDQAVKSARQGSPVHKTALDMQAKAAAKIAGATLPDPKP